MLTKIDALFSSAAQVRRGNKGGTFVCCHCDRETERRSNSQKMCADCKKIRTAEIHKAKHARKQEARGVVLCGTPIKCAGCDAQIVRRNSNHRFCTDCRKEADRAKWRAYTQKRDGVLVPCGETIACEGCGCGIVKRGGQQKYCSDCRKESQRTIDRLLKRQQKGGDVATIGDPMTCCGCDKQIIRLGAAQQFCEPCAKKSKLKLARKWRREARRDPMRRLNWNLSSAICRSLKRGGKGKRSWETLVGYTFDDLAKHLSRKFKKGMTFENHGEWHIDHIRPLASFNFETPDDPEFKIAWSLSNLQPLWAAENIAKRDKLIYLL